MCDRPALCDILGLPTMAPNTRCAGQAVFHQGGLARIPPPALESHHCQRGQKRGALACPHFTSRTVSRLFPTALRPLSWMINQPSSNSGWGWRVRGRRVSSQQCTAGLRPAESRPPSQATFLPVPACSSEPRLPTSSSSSSWVLTSESGRYPGSTPRNSVPEGLGLPGRLHCHSPGESMGRQGCWPPPQTTGPPLPGKLFITSSACGWAGAEAPAS